MAKLKTFEDYIASLDSAEEIEKDLVDMGEPKDAKNGEEVITSEQPDAEAPKKSEDEGAGEEAEELEADTKELYSEEDEETEEGNEEMPEDEGEEGAKEVTEAEKSEEDEDEVETQIADDDKEESKKEESEDEEKKEDKEKEDDNEEAEAQKTVQEMVKELYEMVKSEAKVWEEDMHDTHTIESYLKENAALHAMMAANTLKDCREDITQEAYEAACNSLKESYAKKIDEMMEAWGSEGEVK